MLPVLVEAAWKSAWSRCLPNEFYPHGLANELANKSDLQMLPQLRQLLRSTHIIVPYTSSHDDVWDALSVPQFGATVRYHSSATVRPQFGDISVPQFGDGSGAVRKSQMILFLLFVDYPH
jgi:hypothetical protein